MRCKSIDGTYRTVTWRLFYASCPKINLQCNKLSSGYVAASVVCRQRLW